MGMAERTLPAVKPTEKEVRILMLENVAEDAELNERELRRAGLAFRAKLVMTKADFTEAIRTFKPDLILVDYLLPDTNGLEALRLAQEHDPLVPVIIVTGSLDEETAADSIKAGAADYVTKERLARLGPSISSVLEKTRMRQEKEEAERALRRAHDDLEARVRLRTAELAQANAALRKEADERNRMTVVLRQREREFRTLVENSPDVIERFDRNCKYTFSNPAGERVCGHARDKIVGKTMAEAGLPQPMISKWESPLHRAIAEGKEQRFEFEFVNTTGTHYYHARLVPELDEEGRVETIMAISHDITDLKLVQRELALARETAEIRARQAEEGERTLGAIMDCIPEGIMLVDETGRMKNVSRFAETITGVSNERLIGATKEQCLDLVRTFHRDGINAAKLEELPLSRALRNGEVITNEEWMILRDDTSLFISANAAPVVNGNGRIQGALMAFRDITQTRQNEHALRHAMDFERLIGTMATNFINLKSSDIDKGIENALRLLGRFSQADNAFIVQFENNEPRTPCCYRWPSKQGAEETCGEIFSAANIPWITERIKRRKSLHIQNLTELPAEATRDREFFRGRGVEALLAVPMASAGRFFGFLLFESKRPRSWAEEEIRLLRIVVTMLTNAIDRKRTEEALLASERRYRAIFENTGTAMAIVDADAKIRLVNSEFERLLGYSRQEIEGRKTWRDFVADQDRERLGSELFRIPDSTALPSRTPKLETALVDRKGEVKNVLVSTAFLPDINTAVASVMDISERKRWEEALRESEERLQLVIRNSPEQVFQQDREQRYIWVSRKFTGSPELEQGKTDLDLFPEHEARQLGELKRRVMVTGQGEHGEFELTAGGEKRFFEIAFEPWRNSENRIVGVLGYARNITERRRWEERLNKERERAETRAREAEESSRILEAIMEYTPEGILVAYGTGTRARMMSQYARTLLGLLPEAFETFPAPDPNAHWGFYYLDGSTRPQSGDLPLERAMGQGEAISDEEWIIKRPDGSSVIVSVNAGPILDPRGLVEGAVVTWRDITDRKSAEESIRRHGERLAHANQELVRKNMALDEANEKLKELDKLKSEFVSMASHELRTPLTGIIGFAETLLAKDIQLTEEERSRYLQTIETEGKRLGKLIGEMLDVSKIETGISEMRITRFPMRDLISETVSTLRIPEKVRVEVRLSDERLDAGADRDRIKQVLLNLLDNAIRFSEPEGTITVAAVDRGDMVQVGVSDTGPGIGPEDLTRIFDKFYRNKHADANKGTGSGLGLAIAKSIVEAHGGRIWAESEQGKGSTFYFTVAKEPPKWLIAS